MHTNLERFEVVELSPKRMVLLDEDGEFERVPKSRFGDFVACPMQAYKMSIRFFEWLKRKGEDTPESRSRCAKNKAALAALVKLH